MPNTILPDGMYRLSDPVELPEVLDMLVVGGGPAGTAAAFRAKELGLSALVVDFDDILKRIRDYAKGKPILPSFGGGDAMRFPIGGKLIDRLRFDPIDKDDMCASWKGYYAEECIPVQVSVELTGLRRHEAGYWVVQTWNHRLKQEQPIAARHVVIAIGRGVPRRFDIPGRLDGIAYRLDDAENYVGRPACVIGGGTSAAEAVIAISNAKMAAEDPSPVYWTYRGDKMPRVSKALSEVFFDAYVGNGNIRYHPNSEPAAVVEAPDGQEYLSIRVDWRVLANRPSETMHLEFAKTSCIACIGEDLPEALLGSLGISLFTGGPKAKKRITVSPLLESQQPDVYLIGDILSQAYLEADDFEADPASFREIKHRGNVKSALRDGVFVAEVIRQKLDGKTSILVELEFDERPDAEASEAASNVEANAVAVAGDGASSEKARPVEQSAPGGGTVEETLIRPPGPEGPPEESIPDERKVLEDTPLLVRMTPAGVDEDEYRLTVGGSLTIGRSGTDIAFSEDDGLSDTHATIESRPDGVYIRDAGSRTGTFLQLVPGAPTRLSDGALLRLGQQFLHVAASDGKATLTHYDASGKIVGKHSIEGETTIVLGRHAPDVTLDGDDMGLSRRHISLSIRDGGLYAKDLKSVNGTWLRISRERRLEAEDVVRLGQQIFRLSVTTEQPRAVTSFNLKPFEERLSKAPAPAPSGAETIVAAAGGPPPAAETIVASVGGPAPAEAPADAGGDGMGAASTGDGAPAEPAAAASVTFKGIGKTIPVPNGKTICDVAEAAGIELNAECHAGICGSDPVRIISGAEFLNRPGGEESGTLEDICDLEAGNGDGRCRLACMARVSGPVIVEIVEQD